MQFSVVIPNYNSSRTITQCIEAVLAMKPAEVIVVDDGSTDDSPQLLSKYPIKLIRLPRNVGPAEARNVGVRNAKHPWVMFTDTDVINFPDTLKRAEKFITTQKDAQFVAFVGAFSPRLPHRNVLSNYKHLYLCYLFKYQDEFITTLNTSLTFIRKDIYLKAGGLKQELRVLGEDTELGTRLVRQGYHIRMAHDIQMTHLKRYSFTGFVKDEVNRAKKMFYVFLQAKTNAPSVHNTYKLKPADIYRGLALAGLLLVATVGYGLTRHIIAYDAMLALALVFVANHARYWGYLAKQRGAIFAVESAFITCFDLALQLFGMILGMKLFLQRGA